MKISDALRGLLFKLQQLTMVTLVDAAYWLAVRVLKIGIWLKRKANWINGIYEVTYGKVDTSASDLIGNIEAVQKDTQ